MIRVFLALGAIQFLVMLVQLVKTKTLAVLLGPELVGVMAVIDKLVAVVTQTVSFSLPFAASVFLPALWLRDREAFARLLGRMARVIVVLAVLAAAACVAVTLVEPGIWGAELTEHRSAVLFAFLGVPALALVPFVQNVFAGRLQERRAMGFALLHASVMTVTAIVGVLWMGLQGFYLLYAIAGAGLVSIGLWIVIRSSREAPPPDRVAEEPARDRALEGGRILPPGIWRFSIPLMLLTFAAPFAALFVHYSILSGEGAAVAGWMQAAIGISLAVKGVLGAANGVFLTPNVNRGGSPEESMAWANVYGRTMILLAATLVPPLLLFADLAIWTLYSASFLPGARFVALFVAVEVVGLVVSVYSALPIAFDHMRFHLAYSAVGQALMVTAALLLIPTQGVTGAGVAMMAPHVVTVVAVGAFLKLRYGLRVPARTVLLLTITLAWIAGAGWLGQAFTELSAQAVGVKIGVYAASLVAIYALLTEDERARFRGLRFLRG